MKQLSSLELNSMSKKDLAATVLEMQQLHQQLLQQKQQLEQQQKQMEQQQKQMEQQIYALNEKIAIMNARHFGRSTEKLETLPGQMNIFNETEVAAAEVIAEPAIEQVVIRRKKNKGQRKED